MIKVDDELLRETAAPLGGAKGQEQAKIIQALRSVLADTLAKFDINTDLRVAHFAAQICHESDGFCTTVEYASGQAYEGRANLGNTQPGDGVRYKGRGLIQLTGRANYKQYGDLLGLNLVGDPVLAAEPATSLLIACQYWKLHNLNEFADKDDIETITRRINGGLNGLPDRRACLARAKAALSGQGSMAATGSTRPALRFGDSGQHVSELQSMLRAKGFEVLVDGQFGASTEVVLKQFQASSGLPIDGVVGERTWAALAVGGSTPRAA